MKFIFLLFISSILILNQISFINAYGESVGGYPNAKERENFNLINLVRMFPLEYKSNYMSGYNGLSNVFTQYGRSGVPPVYYDINLNKLARSHSQDMATNRCFQHDSCNGESIWTRFDNYITCAGQSSGENIAAGSTPFDANNLLVCDEVNGQCAADNSGNDGHRVNIMSDSFKTMGVGWVEQSGSSYSDYLTQDFHGGNCNNINNPIYSAYHTFYPSTSIQFIALFYSDTESVNKFSLIFENGTSYNLQLTYGSASKGAFITTLPSVESCAKYYFSASTSSNTYKMPETGYFQVSKSSSCAGWIDGETSTPVTEAPTTQAPTTEAPTTVAPTTEAPTTEAPTTEAPTTEAPTTEAPTTEAPTTEAPTTQAPTTEAPTTQAPTTEAPTTQAPTTQAPTTEAPTTEAPTTEAPTTEAPTTEAPTTEAPTTEAPTTEAPTTEAPTTQAPTTQAPTTQAPTTQAPTTQAPTTQAPTTESPSEISEDESASNSDNESTSSKTSSSDYNNDNESTSGTESSENTQDSTTRESSNNDNESTSSTSSSNNQGQSSTNPETSLSEGSSSLTENSKDTTNSEGSNNDLDSTSSKSQSSNQDSTSQFSSQDSTIPPVNLEPSSDDSSNNGSNAFTLKASPFIILSLISFIFFF